MTNVSLNIKTHAPNAAELIVSPELSLFYSYETIVAFKADGHWFVSENIWTKTTARHISTMVPEDVARLTHGVFEHELARTLGRVTLSPFGYDGEEPVIEAEPKASDEFHTPRCTASSWRSKPTRQDGSYGPGGYNRCILEHNHDTSRHTDEWGNIFVFDSNGYRTVGRVDASSRGGV